MVLPWKSFSFEALRTIAFETRVKNSSRRTYGFAIRITLFWSSKNHCFLLHKRLVSKIIPRKLNGFAEKITFFSSSKNHCVLLLHKRLGSKIVPGELHGFAMKITLFWSSKNNRVLLHKRVGSKIILRKWMALLRNLLSFEALETIAFYFTRDSGQNLFPENSMALLWNSPSLKL